MKEKIFSLIKEFVYRYSEEEFTLASGKKSHHYFNCKEITLYPDRLSILAEYFVKEHIPSILPSPPESVGGLTLGADPISYSIALEYSKSNTKVFPLVVRKESKDHGTKKEIEGAIQLVKSCLVIDDVITTGGSTIKAVESLRRAGLVVDKGICILDREEGGNESLSLIGIKMFPIFKKSDFI
ncbi:MAG: orotate phosphoribosyltransferase [Leptospiraceae bacterium]|nr:orotate phosphoribosyltransferase [Leptospiraceae bacterium]MCK6379993.1 orotate phosphoribosyltransferase [Leptospiraceae bacterium]NUM40164.1 orotate phosphoribosyltransferase [Leptospiraceae bacterium]